MIIYWKSFMGLYDVKYLIYEDIWKMILFFLMLE
jgi:hypothetical protein